jgi:hypothetical protein
LSLKVFCFTILNNKKVDFILTYTFSARHHVNSHVYNNRKNAYTAVVQYMRAIRYTVKKGSRVSRLQPGCH